MPILACLLLLGAPRTVALTFDDLPAAGTANPDRDPSMTSGEILRINAAILSALRAHHAPAIGFVNERGVAEAPELRAVLARWIAAGMDLGNHSYAHRDLDAESVEEFEREVEKGEASIRPLMGERLAWFRFPMNHAGDTQAKHDAVARYLAGRGYRVATCTIENEDYVYDPAYRAMAAAHDDAARAKLRADYLRYTAEEIDYYSALGRQVFGREIAQVMLLHVNRLNAELLDAVLRLFEERGYRFVTLAEAQADAAYRTPDTFVSKFGPMWGYRWATVLRVHVDGSREQEPPAWVTSYGR